MFKLRQPRVNVGELTAPTYVQILAELETGPLQAKCECSGNRPKELKKLMETHGENHLLNRKEQKTALRNLRGDP